MTTPGFSVVYRAPNVVDLLIPKTVGTDGYRLKSAPGFDTPSAFVTLFTLGNDAGALDPAVEHRVLSTMPGTNRVRAVFDPRTYSHSLEDEPFWLVLQPVVGGVGGLDSDPALISTTRQRSGLDQIQVQGLAPLGADVASSLTLRLGYRIRGLTITNHDGARSLFIAFDSDEPEVEVPPNQSSAPFGTNSVSALIVRGAGGTVAFSASFFMDQGVQNLRSWYPVVGVSGSIVLPALRAVGVLTVLVRTDSTVVLPSVQVAGAFTIAVTLSASQVTLPSLELAGASTVAVELAVSGINLPSVQLNGQSTVAVAMSPATVLLPSLQLAGVFTVAVALAASVTTLPSLQIGGVFTIAVSLTASTATLPSLQLAGVIASGTNPVSAWLRLDGSTTASGHYTSIPDVLNVNPAVQIVPGRQPTVAMSANGLPVSTWDGSDVVLWPMVASNNSTTKWGLMLWIKPVTNISTRQRILHGSIGTNSNRTTIDISGGGISIGFMFTGASSGRSWEHFTCTTANVWQCIRVQFDGTLTGDDNVMQVFKNEVKVTGATFTNIGSFVAMTAMNAPAGGTYLLGGAVLDQDAPPSPLLNGVQTGPNWFLLNDTPSATQTAALMSFESPSDVATFAGVQVPMVSAWLRLGGGATTGLGYSSVPDVLVATNPAVQVTDGRRPIPGVSPNQNVTAVHSKLSPSEMTWPIAANNNTNLTTKFGFARWVKLTSGSGLQCLLSHGGSTASVNNCKIEIYIDAPTRKVQVYYFGQDTTGYNGRIASTASTVFAANTWFFLRIQFDGSQATEALRCITLIDEVVQSLTFTNLGTGGTPVALRVVGGGIPIVLGNYFDSTDTSFGSSQAWGPNGFLLSDTPSPSQALALKTFEAPTDIPTFGGVAITAVTAWLRNVTTGPVSSILNVMEPGTAAVQSGASTIQPVGNADGSITFDGTDYLLWPVLPGNNGTVTWGICGWFSWVAGMYVFTANLNANGTSGNKVDISFDSNAVNGIMADIYSGGGTACRARTGVAVPTGLFFLTIEFNGGLTGDANRLVITVNGTPLTLGFVNNGLANMPAACPSVTGNWRMGAANDAGTGAIVGRVGRNIFVLGAAMAGVTSGLLSPAARTALMAYEPLLFMLSVATITLPSLTLAGTLTVAAYKVSSFPRLALSTPVAGEWPTVVDAIGGASLVQPSANRKAAVGTVASVPTMVLDGSDMYTLAISANTYSTTKFGYLLWFKPATVVGTQTFFFAPTNGAVLQFYVSNANLQFIILMDAGATKGRSAVVNNVLTAGLWHCIYWQYDSSRGGDPNEVLYLNGVATSLTYSNQGIGQALGVLQPLTGNLVWFAGQNSDTPSSSIANGGEVTPPITFNDNLTADEIAFFRAFERPFEPNQVAAVSGWLRLASSTAVSSEWPTVVDILNAASPMVQTSANRKTAVGATSNALPTMVFDGSDMHLWPLSPAASATTKVGIWIWYKPASVTSYQPLYFNRNGAGGATTDRISFRAEGTKLHVDVFVDNGGNGRAFDTANSIVTIGIWGALYLQYDSSRGGDANVAVYVDGVSKALTPSAIGTGGSTSLGALQAATGSAVLGSFNDSDAGSSPLANGAEFGPNIYALNDNLTAAQIAALFAFERPFEPNQIVAVSGWLRLASSTAVSTEWPTVVDIINAGSPMVQTSALRKAAVGGTSNGLPTMLFDGTDVHLWPLSPAHSSTTKVGLWFWFKPASAGGSVQWLYSTQTGTAGSTGTRLRFGFFSGRFYGEAYIDNTNGRFFASTSAVVTIGTWSAVYMQYDSSRGGDANLVAYVNGAAVVGSYGNLGAGGTLGALQVSAGSATIGAQTDSDTPSQPITIGGEIGPNILALNDNLTAAQIAALFSFERPFEPNQIAAVSGWLRLASSTAVTDEWPTVVDIINVGSPMVQTSALRKAAVGVTSNGYPTLVFDGTDVHLWPLSPAHSATTKVGIWFWFKPASITGYQLLYDSEASAPEGVTNSRLRLYANNAALIVDALISNSAGRSFTASSALVIGTWHAIYVQYDSSRGGDANVALYVGGTVKSLTASNIGAGGTLGALQAAAGSALFGGDTNSDTPSNAIANGGEIGPNILALSDNLTAAQIASLFSFERPFEPNQIAAVSGWLRLASSTAVSGEWPTVVDIVNAGSPMAQTSVNRKAAVGTTGTGLPTMVFDASDVYLWPASPAHSSTTKVGIWLWFKPAAVAGTQILYRASASGGFRFQVYASGNVIAIEAYISGSNGRYLSTPAAVLTLGVWHAIYVQYDSSRGGDANVALYMGGSLATLSAANLGAGGTLGALQAAVGSALVGGGSDADAPGIPIANGGEIGPNLYALNDNLTTAQIGALFSFERPFEPNQIAAVSGWLRLASSTAVTDEWPTVVDIINAGSPLVQTSANRKAAVGATSNALPTMVFDGSDMHLWPMSPSHSSTTKVGIWLWFKPASDVGYQWLYSVIGTIAGAPNNRMRFGIAGTAFYLDTWVNASNARSFSTASGFFPLGVWTCVYVQYDSSRGGDANLAVFKNGVVVSTTPADSSGTVGPTGLGVLPAAGGSALIGAFNESDTPSQPILNGGEIGPNILALNDNLTAAQIAALLSFERPFEPNQIASVSSWIRLASSTAVSGEWPTVVDIINAGSPMAQSSVNRKAAVGATINGLPTMVFDGSDVLLWPQSPGHSLTTKVGVWFWFKPAATVGLTQALYFTTASGSTRLSLWTSQAEVRCEAYLTNANGRNFIASAVLSPGLWTALYMQYDSSRGGDANMVLYVNGIVKTFAGVFNIGAGGTLGALQAATGSATVGGTLDADGNNSSIGNGGEIGPNIYAFNENLTAAQIAALLSFERPFEPNQIAAVSAWLRLTSSTAVSGEWPTVVDLLNAGSPMVQTSTNRKAAVGATTIGVTGFGLPTMVFDSTDVHLWPLSPAHSSTTKVGIFLWHKPALLTGDRWLYVALNGLGGVTANRMRFATSGTTFYAEIYSSATLGRYFTSAAGTFVAGRWHSIYVQYDSSRGGDGNLVVYINGVALSLTPGALGGLGASGLTTLMASTGSALVGARSDSDTPSDPIADLGEIGPNVFAFNDNLTIAQIATLLSFERPFEPNQIAAVSGWLRLASSTAVSGEWPTVVDLLNAGSPMVQTDVDRRAAVGASANGLPTMVFDGTDVHLWPASPALTSTTKCGLWFWVKLSATAVSTGGGLFSHINGMGGSSLSRFDMIINNGSTTCNLQVHAYITNTTGRSFGTAFSGLTSGIWYAMYLQYDSSRGGDANVALYINGVLQGWSNTSNIGAGGTLTTLQAANGSLLMGAWSDADAPSSPIGNGAEFGPNILAFNDNLTAAQIAFLLTYDAPSNVATFGGLAISAVTAWLRLQVSSQSGSDWTNWCDIINHGPAASIDSLRRPAVGSVGALPTAIFDGALVDTVSWPLITANNGTQQLGFWLCIKPTVTTGTQYVLSVSIGTGGASVNKVNVAITNGGVLVVDLYFATVARTFTSSAAAITTAAQAIGFTYDNAAGALDTDKFKVFVGSSYIAGTYSGAGVPGALPAATGNLVIGNYQDASAGAVPYTGVIGPNVLSLNRHLTATELATLNVFETFI